MKKLGIWSCILLMLTFGILPVKALAGGTEELLIPVRVLAEGSEPEKGAVYTVELEAETPGAPMPEGSLEETFRMMVKSGETGYICIPCRDLGVFDYTVRQAPGTDLNCTYDSAQYRLRLFVTLTENGSKEVSALVLGQGNEKATSVVFQNHWADPVYLSIFAWKTLDGNAPRDGAFTFRLLAEDGEVIYETENDGRRVRFPALRFDREGTFRFFLKEVAGKDKKILYDRAVYTITVTVTRDADYRAEVTYERNGKPWSGTPSFANFTDTGSPKTGDDIGIWVSLLGISAAALGVLLVFRRKKQ